MARRLRVVDETDVMPELDVAIRRGLCICFPDSADNFAVTRTWHGSGPSWSAVVEEDGRILAHAGAVERTVRVGCCQLRVAGIQNVFALPECRKTGLADDVMRAVIAEAVNRRKDFGLLFCIPKLDLFYSRLGWRKLPDVPVTRIDAGVECPIPGKNIAMYYPMTSPEFPAGPIYLQGNDW